MYIDPGKLKPNSELRFRARERLRGNWFNPVITNLVFAVLKQTAMAVPYLGILIILVVGGPLYLGINSYFLRFARKEPDSVENLFDGFKRFESSLALYLLFVLFVFIWSLLLIIPGIVATYAYSMAFFIMHDNPGMDAMEAIRRSRVMMRGQKLKLFELHLSFIGWAILCIFTLGIGFLWLSPYIYTAEAYFYEDLKNAADHDAEGPEPLLPCF